MKEVKNNETSQMSLSKTRKIERKKAIAKGKKDAVLNKIISICVISLLSVGLLVLIGYQIYRGITKVTPTGDYSTALSEDGLIDNVVAKDLVTLPDYKGIKIPLSEIEYSDESVEKDIKELVSGHAELSKETDAKIADGDEVNIDYVGSVDGVEFEGGNSNGEGYDLTIGSGDFIEGFEEQLIGHGIGDEVKVEVTFPTDYKTDSLAGKDAVFQVVINGIYVAPEFTDEFVAENLELETSTVEFYKSNLKEQKYKENLTLWLIKYLNDNTTVTSYPNKYMKSLMSLKKAQDIYEFEYMKQLYASFGSMGPVSFSEYIGMSEAKYDRTLSDAVKDQAKLSLALQAIYEIEGLTASADEYTTYFNEKTQGTYDSRITQFGKGYTMQQLIAQKVIEYLSTNAVIE